jgi:small nuclear ribonucleoprotein (snRNP)-like protein
MWRVNWLSRLVRETIVVHTTGGASIRGVLVGVYRDCVVLQHAKYLTSDTTEDVDGEAIIPRQMVAWMQRLPGSDT